MQTKLKTSLINLYKPWTKTSILSVFGINLTVFTKAECSRVAITMHSFILRKETRKANKLVHPQDKEHTVKLGIL